MECWASASSAHSCQALAWLPSAHPVRWLTTSTGSTICCASIRCIVAAPDPCLSSASTCLLGPRPPSCFAEMTAQGRCCTTSSPSPPSLARSMCLGNRAGYSSLPFLHAETKQPNKEPENKLAQHSFHKGRGRVCGRGQARGRKRAHTRVSLTLVSFFGNPHRCRHSFSTVAGRW